MPAADHETGGWRGQIFVGTDQHEIGSGRKQLTDAHVLCRAINDRPDTARVRLGDGLLQIDRLSAHKAG